MPHAVLLLHCTICPRKSVKGTITMKRYGKMAMLLAAGAAALTAGSIQAQAQDAGSEPVILTGGVTFLTDYRLRGASLSDNKPVIQGGVRAEERRVGKGGVSTGGARWSPGHEK